MVFIKLICEMMNVVRKIFLFLSKFKKYNFRQKYLYKQKKYCINHFYRLRIHKTMLSCDY